MAKGRKEGVVNQSIIAINQSINAIDQSVYQCNQSISFNEIKLDLRPLLTQPQPGPFNPCLGRPLSTGYFSVYTCLIVYVLEYSGLYTAYAAGHIGTSRPVNLLH